MSEWMQRYLDAWNAHDSEQVAAWMAPDATYEDIALGVVHTGRDAIRRFAEETDALSNDYRFELVSAQADGDRYAAEWDWVGRHTGSAEGVRATNRTFRLRGVSVGQLDADGLISTNRDYWSLAELFMQLGILPSRGSTGERVMKRAANGLIRARSLRPG